MLGRRGCSPAGGGPSRAASSLRISARAPRCACITSDTLGYGCSTPGPERPRLPADAEPGSPEAHQHGQAVAAGRHARSLCAPTPVADERCARDRRPPGAAGRHAAEPAHAAIERGFRPAPTSPTAAPGKQVTDDIRTCILALRTETQAEIDATRGWRLRVALPTRAR